MNKYKCKECNSEFSSKQDIKKAFCPVCESPNIAYVFSEEERQKMQSHCDSCSKGCNCSCH